MTNQPGSVELSRFLESGPIVDSDDPRVREYSAARVATTADPIGRAVALYYAVRDEVRYDPYSLDLSPKGLAASTTLEARRGWCVAKAILLAACCRSVGIPARLGFADVRNHLSTERMRESMKTDVFYWHGYTSIFLDGQWVKATPAFNVELCEKFGLHPLEFDGREDSIYHPFDLAGNRHMEYLRDRGEFAEPPIEQIVETFRREYSGMMATASGEDFDRDVEREVGTAKRD
jgi:transglutaminase-like putative cysteine protease